MTERDTKKVLQTALKPACCSSLELTGRRAPPQWVCSSGSCVEQSAGSHPGGTGWGPSHYKHTKVSQCHVQVLRLSLRSARMQGVMNCLTGRKADKILIKRNIQKSRWHLGVGGSLNLNEAKPTKTRNEPSWKKRGVIYEERQEHWVGNTNTNNWFAVYFCSWRSLCWSSTVAKGREMSEARLTVDSLWGRCFWELDMPAFRSDALRWGLAAYGSPSLSLGATVEASVGCGGVGGGSVESEADGLREEAAGGCGTLDFLTWTEEGWSEDTCFSRDRIYGKTGRC